MAHLTLTTWRTDTNVNARSGVIGDEFVQPIQALIRELAAAAEGLPADRTRRAVAVIPTTGDPIVVNRRISADRYSELVALVDAAEAAARPPALEATHA